jgi:predicted dehydrogenase
VTRLRLVFLGGGSNSAVGQAHYIASQMDRNFEVVGGLFNRQADANKVSGKHYSISPEMLFPSVGEMIARKNEYDAVVVLTPTPNHFENLTPLLQANVSVICEKSVTSTLAQAIEIQSLIQNQNLDFFVTFNYSGYPMVRLIREMVLGGELGELISIRVKMPQEGFLRRDRVTGSVNPPQLWRQTDGEIPTILLDLGVHVLHLASFTTGMNPNGVFSRFGNHSSMKGVVDEVEILAEYENGMIGSFWVSKTALGEQNGLEIQIFGTSGSIGWKQIEPNKLVNANQHGEVREIRFGQGFSIVDEPRYNRFKAGHPGGFIEAFANLYADIKASITEPNNLGREMSFAPGISQAKKGLEILEGSVKSHVTREWVSV